MIVSYDTIMNHKIPFNITPSMLSACLEISRILGKYEGLLSPKPQPQLRRANRIKTIQGSLAIEGNTLSIDQVTAVFEKKKVIGNKREILEVTNAIEAYDKAPSFDPASSKALLRAHGILMKGLEADAGKWRTTQVGIFKGSKVSHVAPKPEFVPELMAKLFSFLKNDKETHAFIKACVFHYELEFIHPFTDGNGRIGRLWQHVILLKNHPLFEFIPVESVIKKQQKEYYRVLEKSDKAGDSSAFIEFSLNIIIEALNDFFENLKPEPQTTESRLELAKNHFGADEFKRKDYIGFFKTLSTATASRDLQWGVKCGLLKRTGTKALTVYCFKG
jgi:Fic family protein